MTQPLQWFRMYHRVIDDEKVRLLAFEDRWHFVALCALKCSGLLDEPETEVKWRKVAVKMDLSVTDLMAVFDRLTAAGLVIDRQPTDEFITSAFDRLPPAEWAILRSLVFERDDFTCQYCGGTGRLECDHVVPVARGGGHDLKNLATACKPCNQSKGSKLLSEWRQ